MLPCTFRPGLRPLRNLLVQQQRHLHRRRPNQGTQPLPGLRGHGTQQDDDPLIHDIQQAISLIRRPIDALLQTIERAERPLGGIDDVAIEKFLEGLFLCERDGDVGRG